MKELPSVSFHSEAAEKTVTVARNRRPTLLTRASCQTSQPYVLIVLSGDDLEMHRLNKEKFGSVSYTHSTNQLSSKEMYLFRVMLK